MSTTKSGRSNFVINDLHPIMRTPIKGLIASAREIGFHPFEGYRSPERQDDLFAGGKVTKARPWQSAHQYGLAVDFAVLIDEKTWTWPDDARWGQLKDLAGRFGLTVPIKWDKGHVEHPAFNRVKHAFR